MSPELAGPLSSPFLNGRHALDQYRLGPKALRAGKMYKNLATARKEKVRRMMRVGQKKPGMRGEEWRSIHEGFSSLLRQQLLLVFVRVYVLSLY